jgi:hypothetical protein
MGGSCVLGGCAYVCGITPCAGGGADISGAIPCGADATFGGAIGIGFFGGGDVFAEYA